MPTAEQKRERMKAWARRDYPSRVVTYLVRNARTRARKAGVPCTITRRDVVIPKTCPILGIPLKVTSFHQSGRKEWGNSPSIDRIIPREGYVPGNIQVISLRANRIKRDTTVEELRLIYEACRDRHR